MVKTKSTTITTVAKDGLDIYIEFKVGKERNYTNP